MRCVLLRAWSFLKTNGFSIKALQTLKLPSLLRKNKLNMKNSLKQTRLLQSDFNTHCFPQIERIPL